MTYSQRWSMVIRKHDQTITEAWSCDWRINDHYDFGSMITVSLQVIHRQLIVEASFLKLMAHWYVNMTGSMIIKSVFWDLWLKRVSIFDSVLPSGVIILTVSVYLSIFLCYESMIMLIMMILHGFCCWFYWSSWKRDNR